MEGEIRYARNLKESIILGFQRSDLIALMFGGPEQAPKVWSGIYNFLFFYFVVFYI